MSWTESGRDRMPQQPPRDEAALVREAREVARQLGQRKRRLEELLKAAQALLAERAEGPQRKPMLAAALPHMVRVLEHARLSIEEGWDDLDIGFSVEDLTAASRPQAARRKPKRSRPERKEKAERPEQDEEKEIPGTPPPAR